MRLAEIFRVGNKTGEVGSISAEVGSKQDKVGRIPTEVGNKQEIAEEEPSRFLFL